MNNLWFTKEQIETEEKAGRFNSPWDERSFRSRILQDWLSMYDEVAALLTRAERAEADVALSSEQHERTLDEVETLTTQLVAEADRADRAEKDAERLAEALREIANWDSATNPRTQRRIAKDALKGTNP